MNTGAKTFFISYGDSNFTQSKKRIGWEAINMGFDHVDVYEPADISESFILKTQPYISHPRGGGYWLWKSFFIKKTFEKMKVGDICIYADAGCHVNIHGKQRLQEYYDMINQDSSGIISFHLGDLQEEWYTTEKVFEFFDIPKDNTSIRKSSQYMATILIMRKCEASIDLVEKYYSIAVNRPDLFSDAYNCYNSHPTFRDHRHDQSIFSILRKQYGSIVIPDETYNGDNAPNWNALKHIPILSTRIKR